MLKSTMQIGLAFSGFNAEGLVTVQPPEFDIALLQFAHAHAAPTLDKFMLSASYLGQVQLLLPMCIVVGIVIGYLQGWRAMLFFSSAGLGAWGLNVAIKDLVQRPRPHLWPSIAPEPDFSFPSGHAMSTMAITLAVFLLLPRASRWWALPVAALVIVAIGVSRVYLGVHYPTDVLSGWCLGAGFVAILASLMRLISRRNEAQQASQQSAGEP